MCNTLTALNQTLPTVTLFQCVRLPKHVETCGVEMNCVCVCVCLESCMTGIPLNHTEAHSEKVKETEK